VPNLFREIIAVVDAVTSASLERRWKLKIMNKNSVALFHRVLTRSRVAVKRISALFTRVYV